MNKTYRLIWNDVRQSWTVTHEAASSRGKPASKAKPLAAILAGALLMHGGLALAIDPATLPTGGQVVSGQASISQSGSAMTINQGSDQAILNWNSFSIGSGASVEFLQPSSSSVALNRVIGTDPSAIYGSLTANGQVFLVNPNGVLFGQGARVDVGGLVASTLNIRDEDFLAGDNRFSRDGATGSVVNQGGLYGKYVALLAPEVRNEGVIVAQQGTVALAAGEAVTLNITGNRLIGVQVDKASLDTLVENKHLIQADDGMVVMSAQSANGLIGRVVNTGAVEARGIVNDGGTIRLLASSDIEHSGSINADAGSDGQGGSVTLMADLANPDSRTVVSGSISARGGSASGDGGFVETSGSHLSITSSARIDTRATNGRTGQWLLDPYDFTIAASGGDITGADLSLALQSNSITIQTAAGSATCAPDPGCGAGNSGGNGDIFVNDAVSWWTMGMTNLTLEAYRDIRINAAISYDSGSTLQINYGMGGGGKAVIAQGVDWSRAQEIADWSYGNPAPVVTQPMSVDNTLRDYWIGAKNVPIYVRPISGTSVYGDSATLQTAYYDAATGGNRINIYQPNGTVTWSGDPSTFSYVSQATFYYVYATDVSSVSSDRYTTFDVGSQTTDTWTITQRPITLTANDQSKTFGTVLDLGNTAFTLTSGTMAPGELVTSATLTSAHGYDASTTQIAGTYNNEIEISGVSGSGGFNPGNYGITWVYGALTINPAAPTPPAPPASTQTTGSYQWTQLTFAEALAKLNTSLEKYERQFSPADSRYDGFSRTNASALSYQDMMTAMQNDPTISAEDRAILNAMMGYGKQGIANRGDDGDVVRAQVYGIAYLLATTQGGDGDKLSAVVRGKTPRRKLTQVVSSLGGTFSSKAIHRGKAYSFTIAGVPWPPQQQPQ